MPRICLIGTGGMLPLKNRWLTSCYIEHNGKAALIDCGEGTQIALTQFKCKISRIEYIFFTHCHADHISGLPGLLLSMGNCSRTQPLDIFLPEGFGEIPHKLMCICDKLPFEVNIHELPIHEGLLRADKIDPLLKICYLPLKHSVRCLGYSFEFGRKPVFLPEKAKTLGIPVQYWKVLHSGENITLEDGRTVTPSQVTGDERKSVKLTYVTDTLPFEEISRFAENSDLFICEGMYGGDDKKESMNKKGHMLMQDACGLAARANAKRLWLTHYSPAEKNPLEYEQTLKDIFPNVTVSKDGENTEI